MKITPLIKGVIGGVAMVGLSLLLTYTGKGNSSAAQNLFYILYAGFIAWALLAYYRSESYKPTFGSIFSQGFKCFIIITLMTVIFVGINASTHPKEKAEALEKYEADLIKQGNRNEAERKKIIEDASEHFVTGQIYAATFATLIIGAVFTAAGAGLLLMRRRK